LGPEILRYADSIYHPSQELRDLVANGFKSNEQIYVERQLGKARKQTIFAFWTMIVAILTLLATLIIPLVTKTAPEKNPSTIIEESTIIHPIPLH
jgi:uncharacterized BrkB/YihY/UPF0761 family membrane protein